MWTCLTTATRRPGSNSGWAELGWAELGWAELGWAGLNWAELDWAELAVGLNWALIGRSGRLDLDRGMFQSASS